MNVNVKLNTHSLFNLPGTAQVKMGIYRRPVSARRSIKKRKATTPKRWYTSPSTRTLSGKTAAGRITGLSRTDFGFPDRIRTKLQYQDVIQLSASAGSPGIWQFRMNSLQDPDYTGVGHQPQWYDQLSAVYSYYRVIGSKITCTFIPNNISDTEANDKGPYICGITTVAGTTSFGAASYPALLEDGNSVNGIIVDKQGGSNKLTLSNTFSPTRDLGITPMDDTLRVGTSSNPQTSSLVFANVWALDMTEAASQDVVVKVQIEFVCEFSVRKENVVS